MALQVNDNTRKEVMQKIEAVVENLVTCLSNGVPPTFSFTNRSSWSNVQIGDDGLQVRGNCSVTTVSFASMASVKKIAAYMNVLKTVYENVLNNTYSTKRDLFYQHASVYGTQEFLDNAIEEVALILDVPRWHLHLVATSKGLVAGNLTFDDPGGNHVDCSSQSTGVIIPTCVQGISHLRTDAKFVLIVEKDASFQQLLNDGFVHKMAPCVVITGKGFPDVNTRMLLRLLWNEFQLPTFALVDADPHGMEIMAIYKYGSKSMCKDSDCLTVPSLIWLGVLPSDIDRLHIQQSDLLPLTDRDISKATQLLSRPYMALQPDWKREIDVMLKMGFKAEIQCLYSIGNRFLSDIYIPTKVARG